ncbi:MAG: helix-turn-helix domain-containing protein [Clostridiales bacterium]|jgi:transcriptional regulator with XRE-family HTH domain|nr:helix-turn-helix domain-containing protein [Clostridiales bacterium]
MSDIHGRFYELRKALQLTQKQFGGRILVSSSYISMVEHGKETPSDILIKLTALEFRVSYDWLTKGEGDMFICESDDDSYDYFERGRDKIEYYTSQLDSELYKFSIALKSLNEIDFFNMVSFLALITRILNYEMKSEAQKHLLIEMLTGYIIIFEEIVDKFYVAKTAKEQQAAVRFLWRNASSVLDANEIEELFRYGNTFDE